MSVRFSPDGKTIASVSHDNTVIIWDENTKEKISTFQDPDNNFMSEIAFSPDGKSLMTGCLVENTVRCWNLKNYKVERSFPDNPVGVSVISFAHGGSHVAFGCMNGSIRVCDVKTGKIKATLVGHEKPIVALAFTKDDKKLLSAGCDNLITQWNLESNKSEKRTMLDYPDPIRAGAFDPKCQIVAIGDEDGCVTLWNVNTGQVFKKYKGHTEPIITICFSNDGALLASGSEDTLIKLCKVPLSNK